MWRWRRKKPFKDLLIVRRGTKFLQVDISSVSKKVISIKGLKSNYYSNPFWAKIHVFLKSFIYWANNCTAWVIQKTIKNSSRAFYDTLIIWNTNKGKITGTLDYHNHNKQSGSWCWGTLVLNSQDWIAESGVRQHTGKQPLPGYYDRINPCFTPEHWTAAQ